MGEVVDFAARLKERPLGDREARKLVEKLHNVQGALQEIYGHIEDAYENLNVMEKECTRVEAFYDETLLELARQIGSENVPVEFFDFSANVVVVPGENGEINLKLEDPEQKFEIVFTPESED